LRWAVNITAWDPEASEWEWLISLLREEEAATVQRFKFLADQKRALVSRLLQRACVHKALGAEWTDVVLHRTKGKKPFYAGPAADISAPNFNFNVSHEGDFVVLASEPVCIIGVDVSAPQRARRVVQEPLNDYFQKFERQCSLAEWEAIRTAGDEAAQETAFQQHWSLKEAMVKARGDGLAFDLRKADFRIHRPSSVHDLTTATLYTDGVEASRWGFTVRELSGGHIVSVARAPPDAVVDAWGHFAATLRAQSLSTPAWKAELEQPWPPFSLLSVSELIPTEKLQAFVEAGGDVA